MKELLLSQKQKQPKKQAKALRVLWALVELYLETGEAVGSQTLKKALLERGGEEISSATIRNYFSELEEKGLLKQWHTSGGRTPTDLALSLYLDKLVHEKQNEAFAPHWIELCQQELKSSDILHYLEQIAEQLSEDNQVACFITAPLFDQDYICDIRLLDMNNQKVLAAIRTHLGLIHTEVLSLAKGTHPSDIEIMEKYCHYRCGLREDNPFKGSLQGSVKEQLSEDFYNEIMLRYFVEHSHFQNKHLIRSGIARLFQNPELADPEKLRPLIEIFENTQSLQKLLETCMKKNEFCSWIGQELSDFSDEAEVAILAVPYRLGQKPAGAVAIIGPTRLPYQKVLASLQRLSEILSNVLTKAAYKYEIELQPEGSDKGKGKKAKQKQTLNPPLLEVKHP